MPALAREQPGVAERFQEQPAEQRPCARTRHVRRDLDREKRLDPEQVRLDRRAGPDQHDPAIAPHDVGDRRGQAGEEHGAPRSSGADLAFESFDLGARQLQLGFEPVVFLRRPGDVRAQPLRLPA